MNFGLIIRLALQRAELPFSIEHVELAKSFANDSIFDLWYSVKADFRQARDQIVTISGSDEYVINKLVDKLVPNSLRGPTTNPRNINYKDPMEFFRLTRNYQNSTGNPYIYTFGELTGIDAQPITGGQVRVVSSLANKTSGTVRVVAGSNIVTGTGTSFSLNDIGLRFAVDGDNIFYRVGQFVSSTQIRLDDVYRGNSQDTANYRIGDVGIHVSVQGYVGGEVDSEDVELNGSNAVNTAKSFSTLVSISKSDLTGGKITASDNLQVTTFASIAPGEYENERQTLLFWRIPSTAETLRYRFYMKHPTLRLDTDRPLLPNKFHRLIVYMTEADLRGFAGMEIPPILAQKLENERMRFESDAQDPSLWTTIPQEEGFSYGYGVIEGTKVIDSDFVGF